MPMSLTYSEVRSNGKASSMVYLICCRRAGNCSNLIYDLCTVSFSVDLYFSLIIIINGKPRSSLLIESTDSMIKLLRIFTQAAERCIITLRIKINTHAVFQNIYFQNQLSNTLYGCKYLYNILETKYSTISSCSNT